ncbi:hypothetical protein [Paenibacillus amylolyticus]|uniref:hypothetical protein n=1 Tax=Paenibacillus amylolyticus TaxID=1451 RepID=UPI002499B4CC|nr:hypothetical protein [Paenibacillus amylolyticus]WFA84705.1 hypothetical protein OGI70_27880 [Paenibacillus amylolyticus]
MQEPVKKSRKSIIDQLEPLEKYVWELVEGVFANTKKNCTIDELAQLYDKETDELILDAVRREGLIFVGGKLYIAITDDELGYVVGVEIYFNRPDGEWVVKKNQAAPRPLDIMLLDSRSELKRLKQIEFELTEPEAGGKHVY